MYKRPAVRYYIRKTPKGWTVQRFHHGKRPKYRTTGLVGTYKSLENALYWLKKRLQPDDNARGWRNPRK